MNKEGPNTTKTEGKDGSPDFSRRKDYKVKSIGQEEKPGQGPRSFTRDMKELCWQRAQPMLGRSPDRWRLDALGNPVFYVFRGCQGPLCHEYDHIVPYSKGGRTSIENCQILQRQVNLYKSNKVEVTYEELKNVSPIVRFTDKEMDIIEKAAYGNVIRPKVDAYVKQDVGLQDKSSDDAPKRRTRSRSPNRDNSQGAAPAM